MLINESKYIKELVKKLPGSNLKILNFGSQSTEFQKQQPYIYNNIIKTVDDLHHLMKNVDIKDGNGVDMVGDIFDDVFFQRLKKEAFDVIFVFNLLEHVTDIHLMVSRLQDLVDNGKYIIYSGPSKYPRHLDPIDNMFRPGLDEVLLTFDKMVEVEGKPIIDFTYSKYYFRSVKSAIQNIARTLAFFYKFNKWKNVDIPKYKWMFRRFETVSVLMQKK